MFLTILINIINGKVIAGLRFAIISTLFLYNILGARIAKKRSVKLPLIGPVYIAYH